MAKRSKKTAVATEYLIALELAADAARMMLDDLPLADEKHDPSIRIWRSSIRRRTLEGALAAVNDSRPPRWKAATYANTEDNTEEID